MATAWRKSHQKNEKITREGLRRARQRRYAAKGLILPVASTQMRLQSLNEYADELRPLSLHEPDPVSAEENAHADNLLPEQAK